MAWVKVPPENRPLFFAALPDDARVEAVQMFGGVAAKVNGHLFAGLFGRSTMVALPEPDRAEALALEGATMFDPMGDGRMRSDKVMLPESVMHDPESLRTWITRAFDAAAMLPKKAAKTARAARSPEKTGASKKAGPTRGASKPAAKRSARRG
jgi:TfoX/Sxy family transcriptional regulator of competence genes